MDNLPSPPPFVNRHREHVIDNLMARREVHILAGASGSSKTTLFMQLADALTAGEDIFGHPSHPARIGYLCADRSDADLARTFERVKVKTDFPRYSLFTHPEFSACPTATSAIKHLKQKHPDLDFIVFDAVSTCVKDVNSAQEVGGFLKSLTKLAGELDITILLIHHTAKMKKDSAYSSPRAMMAGCGAWGGYSNCNLIIVAEDDSDPANPYRILHICPRNSPNFTIRFMLDEDGLLIPVPIAREHKSPTERQAADDAYVVALPSGSYHVSELHEGLASPPQKTFYRILTRWLEAGFITRGADRGVYVKRSPN